MVKNTGLSGNQKLFFDEDITSTPKAPINGKIYSADVIFRKGKDTYSKVPVVEINDALRTVLCNSKVKIGQYDILKNTQSYGIKIYFPIDDGLIRLILTKCVSVIALKYKCDNCILKVDGNEKTICFHY